MENQSYILGDLSINYIIAALLFVGIGFAIVKLISFNRRKKGEKRNEYDFDIWYWFQDNLPDVILNILVTLVFIRFTNDMVKVINHDLLKFGQDPMFIYVLFGVLQQGLIELFRKGYRKLFKSDNGKV